MMISIHAPGKGSDDPTTKNHNSYHISIHAPGKGSD